LGRFKEVTNTIQLSGSLRRIQQLDEEAENFMTIIQKLHGRIIP
jgi:hypothetical protein